MTVHHLSQKTSILNTFISELRNVKVQNDRLRFRRNIERIGEVMAYEISKSLDSKTLTVETPLGQNNANVPQDNMVLCSILRAGIPLHNGLLNYFDSADSAFISAYRKHSKKNKEDFEIEVEYLACPNLNNKVLVLADPMLATGQSLIATLRALKPFGQPLRIHLVSIIGARPGVEFVAEQVPESTQLWIGAIDNNLNKASYIVPGLGDAGDLSFGEKLQN